MSVKLYKFLRRNFVAELLLDQLTTRVDREKHPLLEKIDLQQLLKQRLRKLQVHRQPPSQIIDDAVVLAEPPYHSHDAHQWPVEQPSNFTITTLDNLVRI